MVMQPSVPGRRVGVEAARATAAGGELGEGEGDVGWVGRQWRAAGREAPAMVGWLWDGRGKEGGQREEGEKQRLARREGAVGWLSRGGSSVEKTGNGGELLYGEGEDKRRKRRAAGGVVGGRWD